MQLRTYEVPCTLAHVVVIFIRFILLYACCFGHTKFPVPLHMSYLWDGCFPTMLPQVIYDEAMHIIVPLDLYCCLDENCVPRVYIRLVFESPEMCFIL